MWHRSLRSLYKKPHRIYKKRLGHSLHCKRHGCTEKGTLEAHAAVACSPRLRCQRKNTVNAGHVKSKKEGQARWYECVRQTEPKRSRVRDDRHEVAHRCAPHSHLTLKLCTHVHAKGPKRNRTHLSVCSTNFSLNNLSASSSTSQWADRMDTCPSYRAREKHVTDTAPQPLSCVNSCNSRQITMRVKNNKPCAWSFFSSFSADV